MSLIPINPLRTTDGDLVSLASLRGALRAQPIELDEGTAIGNVRALTQDLSISLGGKLGVGSIFASSVQANEFGFWLDAMASADSALSADPQNIVSQTRWGFGLRILFRARQLSSSVKLNFAILGAAVDLGLASASYEVQTIGLGPMALGSVLEGLSQFGTLRGDTFHDLNTTVLQNMIKLIREHSKEFTPRPVAVQLRIPAEIDPLPKARTEVFTMRRLREGSSIKEALARAAGKYDENVIRAVYRKLAPGLKDADAPPDSVRAKAKQWLG
jgi:hypothetical protein